MIIMLVHRIVAMKKQVVLILLLTVKITMLVQLKGAVLSEVVFIQK
jgi:hypothetical protein